MPQYMTPGVYVEEIPSASKPIEGVSTSVAAFIGLAPFGPINTPVRLSNWGEFARQFGNPRDPKAGPFMRGAYLAHAVYGFFHNGGTLCYVVRVGAGTTAQGAPQKELPAANGAGELPFRVVAREDAGKGTVSVQVMPTVDAKAERAADAAQKAKEKADKLKADDKATDKVKAEAEDVAKSRADEAEKAKAEADAAKKEADDAKAAANGDGAAAAAVALPYSLKVTAGPDPDKQPAEKPTIEWIDDLSTTKGAAAYVVTKVNRESQLIMLEETEPDEITPRPPLEIGTFELAQVDAKPSLEGSQIEGDVTKRTGLDGLAAVDEITMLCVPDLMSPLLNDEEQRKDLQGKMIAHCELAKDRMAILDAPLDKGPNDILDWRSQRGWTSKFGALYYPWIEVMDPVDGQPIMVPPCGHVAGVWSRVDGTRGVHKAPANEVVMGANGLSFQVTDAEQGEMNRQGINCIRSFPGRGIRIWGARTLSTLEDPEWRYINVRRLFNFISESIMEGTQWAVFEPNDASLWTQLRISASNFLTRVWRDGALFGATPAEAFYVKCDAETNPPDMIEAGQVTVEIGIAPVKPAEFVVFRISQFQAGAEA